MPSGAASNPTVLFTAFEPSGDDHASAVIEELRARHPQLNIVAWGGPKMAAAGATIIEQTTGSAVMGLPGVGKILEHVQINRRIEDWLDKHRVALHVPTDSPDANFPISRMVKARGGKVCHLVAPQLWAWRSGRIKKLRAITDHVLCLLPFEEQWFRSRNVPATFIGHPLYDEALDFAQLDQIIARWPTGSPKIALMPGSRPGEIAKGFPLILDAFARIKSDFTNAVGVVAITSLAVEPRLAQMAASKSGWPSDLHIVAGNTDAAVRWCDCALVASGTVTLQVAKQFKPMVTFYKFSRVLQVPFAAFGSKIFKTRYFTLPNLIADAPIVPELIPHFGSDIHDLAAGVYRLLRQPNAAARQVAGLQRVAAAFQGHNFSIEAADIIAQIARST